MIRQVLPALRSSLARPLPRAALPAHARPVSLPLFLAPSARFAPALLSRGYAAAAGLSKADIEGRVMDVMKTFEKVDGGKLSPTATFTSDLGLDSLDAVEVVMAIEEEFGIEIPDAEADEITTVKQAIDYIAKTPEAH